MPQLDISTFPSQIFWLILCFAILCFAMASFLAPRIGDSLTSRQNKLNDLHNSALKLSETADHLEHENQRNLKTARFKVNQQIQHALTDLSQAKDTQSESFEQNIQKKLLEISTALNTQKNDILKTPDQMIRHLAAETYTHLSGRPINADLINESLAAVIPPAKQK